MIQSGIGIEAVYTLTRATKNHTVEVAWSNWYEQMHSRTLEINLGGARAIVTDDPENIKAVLATQFGDYGKGETFHREWHEFLGDSIFSTDFDQWHQSRQLLRPQFVKDRVSDLHTFERHVTILMGKMGGDGEEVDVTELFFAYTLDVATAFLFGKSVDSLDNPKVMRCSLAGHLNTMLKAASSASWSRPSLPRHLQKSNEYRPPMFEQGKYK